jgi:hypothetical protein
MQKISKNKDLESIGILTFHSAYNEGSILQTFCLCNLLNKGLGLFTEVIDHNFKNRIELYGSRNSNDRTNTLQSFINKLPLSKESFLDAPFETFEFINKRYKALIIGSDEIWKVSVPQRNLYPPFPNVYWPTEEVTIPKIAYAGCIGDTNWRSLPDSHLRTMQKSLNSFDLLSVRDQRTFEFLKWLGIEQISKVEILPDPVFSIDLLPFINRKKLKQKLEKKGVDFSKSRIGILAPQNSLIDKLVNNFRARNIQIIAITDYTGTSDVNLTKCGFTPLEWAGITGLMTYCISYRMHGCITCLINNTPFIAFDLRDKATIEGETKIKDLMTSFGLNNFYWGTNSNTSKEILEMCDNLITGTWPKEQVLFKLNIFKKQSNLFLSKIKDYVKNS